MKQKGETNRPLREAELDLAALAAGGRSEGGCLQPDKLPDFLKAK